MKRYLFCIVFLTGFLGNSTFSFAQLLEGKATYISKKKHGMSLDPKKYDKETIKRTLSFFENAFVRNFELTFNSKESIYKEVLKNTASKRSLETTSFNRLYKDLKKGEYLHQREYLNKLFLIKGQITLKNWELSTETKKIGKHTCYKATVKQEVERVFKGKLVKEEVTVVAWYTPGIPVNNGPGIYGGLPGLILEVSDGKNIILCTAVAIKEDQKLKIKRPGRGKKVSQKEFQQIQIEKYKQEKNKGNFRKSLEESRQ